MARPNNIRSGPRPDLWVSGPDITTHEQYIAWGRHKAQAQFRGEPYRLKFEDWQWLWLNNWHRRGRGRHDLMLTRIKWNRAWSRENCMLVTRATHAYNQTLDKYKRGLIGRVWMEGPRET